VPKGVRADGKPSPLLDRPRPQEICDKISATKQAHPYIYTGEVREKMSKKASGHLGELNSRYKGCYRSGEGYILIYIAPGEYRKQADLVMEAILGRPLNPEEIVSHKNRIRDDDRPENLELFANQSEHMSYHAKAGDCFPLGAPNSGQFQVGYDPRRHHR